MPLQHKVRQMSDVTVIEVAGRMVVGEGGTNILDAVQQALDSGERRIVLSLSDVTRMDSSGLGELMAAYNSADHIGGKLKLAGLSPKLARVLQITQLTGVLESYEDAAEAVGSFAG